LPQKSEQYVIQTAKWYKEALLTDEERFTSVVYQENWHKGVVVLLPLAIETY
jgi:hypothetical protein